MNAYDLLDAVNNVPPELVRQAEAAGKEKEAVALKRLWKIAAAAAVLVIVAAAGFGVYAISEQKILENQAFFNKTYEEWMTSYQDPDGNTQYPDFFGGAIYDDNGILVIQLVKDNARIRRMVREALGSDEIRFEKVKYSYAELLKELDHWTEYLQGKKAVPEELAAVLPLVSEMGIYVDQNRVVMGLIDMDPAVQAVILKYADRPKLLAFEQGAEYFDWLTDP